MVAEGNPSIGGDAGTSVFEFVQSVADSVWTVVHNFGRHPASVTVYDQTGKVVLGEVTHDSNLQMTVRFSTIVSGRAVLV